MASRRVQQHFVLLSDLLLGFLLTLSQGHGPVCNARKERELAAAIQYTNSSGELHVEAKSTRWYRSFIAKSSVYLYDVCVSVVPALRVFVPGTGLLLLKSLSSVPPEPALGPTSRCSRVAAAGCGGGSVEGDELSSNPTSRRWKKKGETYWAGGT